MYISGGTRTHNLRISPSPLEVRRAIHCATETYKEDITYPRAHSRVQSTCSTHPHRQHVVPTFNIIVWASYISGLFFILNSTCSLASCIIIQTWIRTQRCQSCHVSSGFPTKGQCLNDSRRRPGIKYLSQEAVLDLWWNQRGSELYFWLNQSRQLQRGSLGGKGLTPPLIPPPTYRPFSGSRKEQQRFFVNSLQQRVRFWRDL